MTEQKQMREKVIKRTPPPPKKKIKICVVLTVTSPCMSSITGMTARTAIPTAISFLGNRLCKMMILIVTVILRHSLTRKIHQIHHIKHPFSYCYKSVPLLHSPLKESISPKN